MTFCASFVFIKRLVILKILIYNTRIVKHKPLVKILNKNKGSDIIHLLKQIIMSKKQIIIYAAVICVIISAVFIVLLPKKEKVSSEKPPHILLIVMDTVRQDHLSCYGYKKQTSPELEKLIKISRIYYNAYSPGGWTTSAHASLFTGLYAVAHKATQENWVLSDQLHTIAEILSIRGYETVGIVENPVLAKPNNFHQGFKKYHQTWTIEIQNKEENTACSLFRQYLKSRNKSKPFFTFINFVEPHSPYNSSRQFYHKFLSDRSIKIEHNNWVDYFAGTVEYGNNIVQHLLELYDAEILYTDFLVGKIIKELKKNNLWKDTVLIVTSDHGENIGDHNMMDHVFSLHESIIKIPLIIHYPKLFSPGTNDYLPTQLVDIFPTLLSIAGINQNYFSSQGYNLLEDNRSGRAILSEYYYPKQVISCFREKDRKNPKLDRYKRKIRALISNQIKLIWGSDNVHELYDLRNDPDEKENLINKDAYAEKKQKMIVELKAMLDIFQSSLDSTPEQAKKKMDKKTLEALKSLGYIK
jgi:arylsulfatase A-like enzyme